MGLKDLGELEVQLRKDRQNLQMQVMQLEQQREQINQQIAERKEGIAILSAHLTEEENGQVLPIARANLNT